MRRCGHEILAVSSPAEAPLKEWATGCGIPCVTEPIELVELVGQANPNYLFSIVNYQVLPRELLALPCVAVNYHDGPLPRYAGVYATSWAILNGETRHGITWHIMIDKIDAGDILKQAPVAIADGDTVHTLNMKCYLAAFRAFGALLQEIESGAESRVQQDLSLRTYFGRSKWASTSISWDWTAQKIGRFCRALAFEPAPNPIGTPTGVINGSTVHIRSAVPCAGSGKPPGTVVEVTANSIQVATGEGDVYLYGVGPSS